MDYEIYYFKDDKGRVPVREFLDALPRKDLARFLAHLTYLKEYGPNARRPFADSLGNKSGLYELRPGKNRVLYFFFERNKIILLHALRKKTRALPVRDIDKALERKEMIETLGKFHLMDFETWEK